MIKYQIGIKIRHLRESKKLSQKEFAQLLGVSNSRVSNWEQGTNRPDVNILADICELLDTSADELLDINIRQDSITQFERTLINQYRAKPELQQAVNILLDLQAEAKVRHKTS